MNRTDALVAVEAMFNANGVSKSAGIIAELATDVSKAHCGACARTVLDAAHDHGPALTVPSFRAAYQRTYASPEHASHIGVSEEQVDVGKIEAQWRQAVRVVEAAGYAPLVASHIAAQMWATSCVPIEYVSAEAMNVMWAKATEAIPGVLTGAKVDAAWDYARTLAAEPPCEMTDERWDQVVGRYEEARNA